jgi:ABC-type uncharacterized transport system involved in gliding motility auxiliary subunit
VFDFYDDFNDGVLKDGWIKITGEVREQNGYLTVSSTSSEEGLVEYGNKTFFLNAINYLLDDEGLINTRTREVKLRLLDKTFIEKHESLIKIINVILPLLLILLFGILYSFLTQRKFKQKKTS